MASLARVPQLALGTWIPMPKKLKNASWNMAEGIRNVTVTMMEPMLLGIRWCIRICHLLSPQTLAARAKSCSLRVSIWARTILAVVIQYVRHMAIRILCMVLPRNIIIKII